MKRRYVVGQGTPAMLVRVAEAGAQLAALERRDRGQDDETIRGEILGRFRREIAAESFGA